MFDRLESTSFFTQKGEQRELLIESDNTDNITFYFDHVEKKPSRIEFKKGENTLSISVVSQLLAREIACGKLVAPTPIKPCSPSPMNRQGMPNLVLLMSIF